MTKNNLHSSASFVSGLRAGYIMAVSLVHCLLLVIFAGCSEERVPTTLPGAHPESWMQATSTDFHGRVVQINGVSSCRTCHGDDLDGGKVRVSCIECHIQRTDGCVSCHGGLDSSDKSGAPPFGLRSETSDTTLAVGAHTIHLHGSSIAGSISCETCHRVPAFVYDSAHFDQAIGQQGAAIDSVAEITWGGLSNLSGQPTWNRTARTCAATYCHGSFPGGDTLNTPVWTASDQAQCGSCHDTGENPAQLRWKHELHVSLAGLRCGDCHANVTDTLLAILAPELHVNGVIDTLTRDTTLCVNCHQGGTLTCTGCHGGVDNETGAPPSGLRGETVTSARAVGAHTKHVGGGAIGSAIPCSSCHVVPDSVTDAGHLGIDSIAEITWSGISDPGGVANWNRVSNACGNTYCHGYFPGGNSDYTPIWTNTHQASCGSCHDSGTQPANLLWKHEFHIDVAGLACTDCHYSVVDQNEDIRNTTLHVNGAVDTLTRDPALCAVCHSTGADQCIRCHGGVNSTVGDPPRGLRGETSTTALAVGAHDKHLRGGSISNGGACNDCHIVPVNITATGHLAADSVAEVVWGNFANQGGGATWNRASRTCASTYCHGKFSGGKAVNLPIWTAANQAVCGSCHDAGAVPALLLGEHERHDDKGIGCYQCHFSTVNSSNQVNGLSAHVDNIIQVTFWNGTGTFNPATKQCSNNPGNCHGTRTW